MKFKKKPVVVEAIQWTGENLSEIIEFTGNNPRWNDWFLSWAEYEQRVRQDGNTFKIITLEGTMSASLGDWIIRGVNDEYYPCKPDIFAKTYQSVDQTVDFPEELPEVNDNSQIWSQSAYDVGYSEGWNDCRKKFIKSLSGG